MTSETIRTVTLLGATATVGFGASVFTLYAHTIMPGLHTTDDRTFVGAFQAIDRAIVNPWFMATAFVGPVVLTAAATIANRKEPAFAWTATALALFVVAAVITIAVNVPLNDAIKAAGDPDRIADLALVRQKFHETRWAAWNLVRVATTAAAFGSLLWALLLHGRSMK
jgi:uncharacterized membrane protein